MGPISLASCVVDPDLGVVSLAGAQLRLTTKEAALFVYLAQRPHQTVSRAELLREVWGFRGRTPNSRAPDFTVLRLRTKVERRPEEPRHLLTVHGVGYRFEPLRPDEQTTLLNPPLPAPEPRWRSPDLGDDEDAAEEATDGPSAGAMIVPPGAPFRPEHMVGHQTERRLAEALLAQPGAPVVVFGPSGLGKTWLLRRLAGGALAEDRVVHLDLRHLDRATLGDRDRFFWRVMADVAEGLSAEAEPTPGLDPARGLTRLLEREGLAPTPGRLLLVIDHAHEAAQLNDPSALYALLRAWCERTRPPWDRLRLLLGVSSEPSLLVHEPHLSPFNLAPPITLSELSADEVRALVSTYGLDTREETLHALIALVGGHPALIRTACFRAATTGRALPEVLAGALGPGGCYESALRHLQRVLGENAPLSSALAQVCAAPGAALPTDAARRLESAGLIHREGPGWAPKNGLVRALAALL